LDGFLAALTVTNKRGIEPGHTGQLIEPDVVGLALQQELPGTRC